MFPIKHLAEEHSALVAKLGRFSFSETAQLVATLSLRPEFHANTVRIEALQHLVAISCKGHAKPERDDLAAWGKLLNESPLKPMEDPVEDVFVGYVNSAFGGFRVFRGIFGEGDFWAERLLAFLEEKQSFPSFQDAIKCALPLLKLSEALVDRVGLDRYSAGSGMSASNIQIPQWRKLAPCFKAVHFLDSELNELGISRKMLQEFILTDDERAKLIGQNLWNSSIERHPLIEVTSGISVIVPSNLVRAVTRYLLERIAKSGIGGWGDMFFHTENASIFVNEIANRLEIKPLNFKRPAWPDGLPSMMPFFGFFDFGKPVIMLNHCIPISKSAADFNGFENFTDEQRSKFHGYLKACASELEKLPGFSGGLILICLSSIGFSTSFATSELNPKWRIHTSTLPDWLTMTQSNDCTAMRLWKLGEHEEVLDRRGTKILNLSGLLNLYAYWRTNGFRLIPRNTDGRLLTMMRIADDFATSFRVETKQGKDIHCVRSHDNKSWVKLTRRNTQSLFKEDRSIRLYTASKSEAQDGVVGCIFQGSTIWWVVSPGRQEKRELAYLVFQLWECVESWVARVAATAAREWPNLTMSSIEIRLDLPNLTNWERPSTSGELVEYEDLSILTDIGSRCISIIIPEGYLKKFGTPKNIAEQSIVASLLKGVAALSGNPLSDEKCLVLTREITGNDDARFFHVVLARNVEQIVAEVGKAKPLFIREEDFTLAHQGVADLVGRPENSKEITGLVACLDFLKETVAKVWERIIARLKPFDRVTVILNCFQALDEIARDEESWNMTARSSFALHNDKENVHEVLQDRRSDRAKASLCNRLIIETAQYSCADGDGLTFTEADHLTILADMTLLVHLSNHRDAIAGGFMEAKIGIVPNGELDVDEKFYIKIFSRYLTKRGRATSEQAVDDYENYFPEVEQPPEDESSDFENALDGFDKVFIPEFGFSVRLLIKAKDEFRNMAITAEMPGGAMNEDLMLRFLRVCGFNAQEAESFLNCFTLPIRSAWNKDLPARCREYDVHPWRHRRQLSLLSRPLVQICTSPRTWLVSVPVFEKNIRYWLGNIEFAHFPKEFFKSAEMQAYVGTIANKRGHEFAEKVGNIFTVAGFAIKLELELTQLGASKKLGLGDLDVLAWEKTSGRVYAVECKRLLTANSVREVVQRLEDFRGNKRKKDSLGRHLRRVEWLNKNLDSLAKFTGIPNTEIRLSSLLVTSEIMPMQFYKEMNFPTSQVLSVDEVNGRLQGDNKH